MNTFLDTYRAEMEDELKAILSYWVNHAVDIQNGGFFGKVDNDNMPDESAAKGSVLNSRILWSFSAAYNATKNVQYLQMAERAYKYISRYFIDKEFKGFYWTVDHRGNPLETKKQIYAQAFAVYGMSEYFKATEDEDVKQQAIALYEAIVKYSYDSQYGGFIEALSREWKQTDELRLSAKDANEKKSMNTHLHVLEAFANLYIIWPDAKLKQHIADLLQIFIDHIVDAEQHHLRLFFNEQWKSSGNIHSYGHDIEAAWLLQEAAEVINDESLLEEIKQLSIKIAVAASEGLAADGGLWYEYDADADHLVKEKHSWPQAEAMIGFYHAWQLTNDDAYLKQSWGSWQFIKDHIRHQEKGEWFWGVNEDYSIMAGQDKIGLWKCPYHNSRACLEILKRTKQTT